MRVDFVPFWLHKDGGAPREYEDAFAPASVDSRPRGRLRCAVADGATESAYSRLWARQLVREFAAGRLTGPDLAELPAIGHRWAQSVSRAIARKGSATWFLEAKADDGAFAAFVGLEFASPLNGGDAGTFAAVALGDSCFVQVRDEVVTHAFPLASSAAFEARPVLLPSRPVARDAFANSIAHAAGKWQSGDTFYVMSDALAWWFLAATERGERPWREVANFARSDRSAFRRWVHGMRPTLLKNDDVTLLRVTLYE